MIHRIGLVLNIIRVEDVAAMRFNCITLCLLLLTVNGNGQELEDTNVSLFANEIETWAVRNKETELFKDMIEQLKIPSELQNSDWRFFKPDKDTSICTICRGVLRTFIKLRRQGMSEKKIKDRITNLCVLLNIQTERVCRGVVELNLPIILYIVDSKPNLTANTICGVVLESKSCPLSNPEFEWSVALSNDSYTLVPENETTDEIQILQITDIHYDPLYEPNGNADCGEPLCCRKGQNKTNKANSLAGFWGDYESCDTPWHSVIDALTHIIDTHKNVDFIYFTGDIIDHGVWETSKEGNIESLKKIYNQIQDTFKNIPVYPIFGNHEPHPLNQFAPKNITEDYLTTNWLYELMADLWIDNYNWLPQSARSTILQGGYYTLTPRKGFRIIALNSNVCYSYNWWLWYSPKDPDGQLQWLADTLFNAERNREFVHILSHIPANSKHCLKTWKREYLKIINRFSHIIKAEFNGHTHNDEIAIFYNSDRATNVAWNGGSITTYSKLNPNYKIYTVNSSNYAVIDYQNWMYDLNLANKHSNIRPTWYESYSFKQEYDLSDLSTESLNKWVIAAAKNETLLNKYYKNFNKQAKPSLQTNCDFNCKRQRLCQIIVSTEKMQSCNSI